MPCHPPSVPLVVHANAKGTAVTTSTLKDAAAARLSEIGDDLLALSRTIHDDPELAFEEHAAAGAAAAFLEAAGFEVETGVYGLATAIEAVYGSGDVRVVVCAEYDALPGIGHACGHNIIATAGIGAAVALSRVADELGLTVVLLGTPAEEHGGGKVLMLEAGAWDEATLSVMVHPGGDLGGGVDVSCGSFSCQAVDRFRVAYEGRAAHAAAAPTQGVNAANAATVAEVAIGLLRQQLPDGVRLGAFVAHGGEVTNIIPARAVLEAEVRSHDIAVLEDVKTKMLSCFEAGAVATGCTWTSERTEPRYEPLVQDADLAAFWDDNLRTTGRTVVAPSALTGGSTDMGNVSQYLPSIHPGITVLGEAHPPHTIGFAAAAATPAADRAVLDAASALAATVIDATSDAEVRASLIARQGDRPGYLAWRDARP